MSRLAQRGTKTEAAVPLDSSTDGIEFVRDALDFTGIDTLRKDRFP